jgi:hypothetical protein
MERSDYLQQQPYPQQQLLFWLSGLAERVPLGMLVSVDGARILAIHFHRVAASFDHVLCTVVARNGHFGLGTRQHLRSHALRLPTRRRTARHREKQGSTNRPRRSSYVALRHASQLPFGPRQTRRAEHDRSNWRAMSALGKKRSGARFCERKHTPFVGPPHRGTRTTKG